MVFAGPARFFTQEAELAGDGGALEMRIDLVVALPLEADADFGGAGAFAGAGELEGSFERSEGLHATPMEQKVLKT
jgi:hypothetical protein